MIKELEDYKWFPALLRRYQADYIGSLVSWLDIYRPLVPVLQELTDTGKPELIQDICSGSGMPAIYMQRSMKKSSQTILSDKYPNAGFLNSNEIEYLQTSVDVLLLSPQPGICYTMYNSLHHFSANDQKMLIGKMALNKNCFLFAEILHPGIFTMIKIVLTTTLLQLFTAPFIKPFSLLRLLFTYIIPFNVLTSLYDGIISVIRSGSINHYRNLFAVLSTNDFEVSVCHYSNWKGKVIYIKGGPVRCSNN